MAEGVYAWRDIEMPPKNIHATGEQAHLNLWLADRIGYKLRHTNKLARHPEYHQILILTDPVGKEWETEVPVNASWTEAMWELMGKGFIERWTNNIEDSMELAAKYRNIRIESSDMSKGKYGWSIACWDEEISETSLYNETNISIKHLPIHIVCCILALTDFRLPEDAVYPPVIAPAVDDYNPLVINFRLSD